jgi:hypothetical protein
MNSKDAFSDKQIDSDFKAFMDKQHADSEAFIKKQMEKRMLL